MEFRTKLNPDTSHRGMINHANPMLLLGSCFSDEMGSRLAADGFDIVCNPGGTLYNPMSIHAWVKLLAGDLTFTQKDITTGPDGRFHSWMHHSSFSRKSEEEALTVMNKSLEVGRKALQNAKVVFITLGTTRVFRLKESGMCVANCHKHHPATFTETRMSLDECISALEGIRDTILDVNKEATIVFTVSPVRHPGQGGLHANALSKATLLLATDSIDGTIYFPAYEALTDDLRDYRFYAPDMRHPSPVAADYIYDLLCESMMTSSTIAHAIECRRMSRRAAHRPMADRQP